VTSLSYQHNPYYHNKEKKMATAKPKKTDHEIIAEELLKAAERYDLCSAFYTEMKKINDKLETKFPDNLLSPKRKAAFFFDNNLLFWENAPTTKAGDVPQKASDALEKHINQAIKEAIASWEGGGTLSGDLKVYIEEIYDNY